MKAKRQRPTGSNSMAFVKQFLNRDTVEWNSTVPGKIQGALDSLTPLGLTPLGSFIFTPGADSLQDHLINRVEVPALQLLLDEPFGLRVELDRHGCLQTLIIRFHTVSPSAKSPQRTKRIVRWRAPHSNRKY